MLLLDRQIRRTCIDLARQPLQSVDDSREMTVGFALNWAAVRSSTSCILRLPQPELPLVMCHDESEVPQKALIKGAVE